MGANPSPLPYILRCQRISFTYLLTRSFGIPAAPPELTFLRLTVDFVHRFMAYSNHALTPASLSLIANQLSLGCHTQRKYRDFHS